MFFCRFRDFNILEWRVSELENQIARLDIEIEELKEAQRSKKKTTKKTTAKKAAPKKR